MTSKIRLLGFAGAVAISALFASPGYAQLNVFQTYTGDVGVSTDGASDPALRTDGVGNGIIRASAPSGSTVVAAYLYTTTWGGSADLSGVTLGGNAVTYTATFPNATACCSLVGYRADVTSTVAAAINGGSGGVYNFTYAEGVGSSNIDGSGLVVVYSNPALPASTVGILNGAASVTGDTATLNFASPLHPGDAGFVANMFLGIGFSCNDPIACGSQVSNITVNGNLMTSVAGNNDDGLAVANGNLITVGSFDDPFTVASPGLPASDFNTDHEAYNLIPFLSDGNTSITVTNFNSSQDDNIFLAVFNVTGEATIIGPSTTPLPATAWLFGSVLGAAGLIHRRRKRKALVSIPA